MKDSPYLRKIVCPGLPPAILHRDALVRRLTGAIIGPTPASEGNFPYKLVLLHAPAGYGKTTLLADFSRQTAIPCCWYLLDRFDADTITFIEGLLASIRQQFPQFGSELDSLLAGAIAQDTNQRVEYRLETVVEALIEALVDEISDPFVLILCNYHEVNESAGINSIVNQLLRASLPCVLVIESRTIPNFEFATLLSHREMFGMSSDLFRLSAQEIRDLANIQGVPPLSDEEAEQLAAAFDGWMAGILLGTRLGNVGFLQHRAKSSTPSFLDTPGIHLDRQLLFAYIVNEVFKHHPDVYAFLKEACILQEMMPSLCDALLDRTDSADCLYYLEQHGLFVTRSGVGSHTTYTCHPILRDLLADELRSQALEHFALLHRRAAELLGAARNYEHAITHALEASAYELAAQFILATQEQMFLQGQVETLMRWIDALPVTIMARSPTLLLIRARLHCMVEEQSQALPLLSAAEEAIAGQLLEADSTDLSILQAEITLLRAGVLFRRSDYHEAQKLCQQVLASLPTDEVKIREAAHLRLGVCATLLGNYPTALTHLQRALQLEGRHTTGRQAADTHTTLASIYSLIGNFALAEHHMSRAISLREETHDVWGKVYDLIRLGAHQQRQGMIVEAESALTKALTISRTMHFLAGQAYALDNLGDLYQEQGQYERSLMVTEEGLVLARQVGDDIYLINDLLCILAMTYLYMGDSVTATLLIAQVDVRNPDGETMGYEQASYELAHGTILLHQHRYDEACASLLRLNTALDTVGLKRQKLQAQIRLAVCYLAQNRTSDAVLYLEKAAATLAIHDCYLSLVESERRRFPSLEQAIKTLPELARLCGLLHLEAEMQETKDASALLLPVTQPLTTTNAQQLRVLALGEPAVFLGEKPITRWRMARAMELFFFLLDCGRPMRKEQILTALWSEVDEHIDRTFHSTVYYLRKTLGEACFVSSGGGYSLDLTSQYGSDICYDIASFQECYENAKQALARNDEDAAQKAFESMIVLYRGDYLQSFYSDWCSARRDELRRIYLDARHQLAHIAWRREQYDASADHWRQMLALDNCLEEAHYGLMRYYLHAGKRGLALRQYQRYRDTLQQELGVQPGPTIQGLYQRLVTTS